MLEEPLIEKFVDILTETHGHSYEIDDLINVNCNARKTADVEFVATSGVHWAIEAKSTSEDVDNAAHKLFGIFLKETGKNRNAKKLRYGLLIPSEGIRKYSGKFNEINRDKFVGFGRLIPVSAVFCCEQDTIVVYKWSDFYDLYSDDSIEPDERISLDGESIGK